MTAHVTREQHDTLERRVEKNDGRIDELKADQAATGANVTGLKEQLTTVRSEQREDFQTVHSRINKQGRWQMGILFTSLLTLVSVLGVVIAALIKFNGGG